MVCAIGDSACKIGVAANRNLESPNCEKAARMLRYDCKLITFAGNLSGWQLCMLTIIETTLTATALIRTV